MSDVCLTDRQQKFYNYFINHYKSNGCFPNPTEAARDMNVSSPAVSAMYGTLLLKGVFSNGQPLTSTYKARHNATPVAALDLAKFKFTPKAKVKAAKPKAEKPKTIDNQKIATLLFRLMSGENLPNLKEEITSLL